MILQALVKYYENLAEQGKVMILRDRKTGGVRLAKATFVFGGGYHRYYFPKNRGYAW